MKTNPLTARFRTPHQTAPFNRIKNEHFVPAFREAIKQGEAEIRAIAENRQAPTFNNTIAAIDRAAKLLNRTAGIFFNLLDAETNSQMQQIARQVMPMLTKFQNNITLNEKLFLKVKTVYALNRNPAGPGRKTLLENTYRDFVRNGANLSAAGKKTFRKLSAELAAATLKFEQNVLAETNSYQKHITDPNLLGGLPPGIVEAAAELAKTKRKPGWIFNTTAPSYQPVMKYAHNRSLRKELYLAYNSRAFKNNRHNNTQTVVKIVNTRLEIARLMGYANYADYVLEQRMASNQVNVFNLLDNLYEVSYPAALNDRAELQELASGEGFNQPIMPWDWAYYSEKLKMKRFALNDETLKPYFELNRVINGVFGLATTLYGITFRVNNNIPVYHPEVIPYEVFDADGKFLAVLYADFHPRPGKQSGAWMNNIKEQWKRNGIDSRPHIVIVMNFTRPLENKPALLTFGEMKTLLHEFGHALHGILSNTGYAGISGTNVYRDFVELPSQIMENWAVEKEFLHRFARHWQTGEKIPVELIENIKAASVFQAGGYLTIRQLSFAYLDMAWHTLRSPFNADVKSFEENAWEKTGIFPPANEATCMSTQFGHLFAGGYAAGYYSYKWAEVLDADAFGLFREKGIFNTETAEAFRKNILEKGGAEHPMVLYKRFRGKEPTIDALLERNRLK